MTLYRLWAGNVVKQDPSKYFNADVDYIKNVSEDIGVSLGELEDLRDEALLSFEGDETSDPSKNLIAAVFIGDTEWYQLLEEWLPFPFNELFLMMDSKVHKLGTDTAKEYGSLENLGMPDYSRPEDLQIDGELPTKYTESAVEQYVLTVAILDLEWYAYAGEEAGLDIDREFIDRAREETLLYFTGRKDSMPEDVKEFQASLLLNAAIWCEEIVEDFGFNSKFLEKTSDILRKEANTLNS